MNKTNSGWFNTYKYFSLVVSIMGIVSSIPFLLIFIVLSISVNGNPSYQGHFDDLKGVLIRACICNVCISILFLIAYLGLKKSKKMGLYMIYAKTIIIPACIYSLYLEIKNWMLDTINKTYMQMQTKMELGTLKSRMMFFNNLIFMFFAIVFVILLTLNSIYFYKRRKNFS